MKLRKQKISRFFTAFFIIIIVLASPGAWAALDSLPGSDFEIDVDADLIVDEGLTWDWGNVVEDRTEDEPSGSATDNAFGMGTSEDTEPPSPRFGGIPPNKSDLKFFGVYQEENAMGKFLHLFWSRVQDPKGTTNMDFEFNQSDTISANGVTPVRTSGDFLVVYELSKGGTVPELFLFKWLDGTEGFVCEAGSFPCWGDRTDLTASGSATGSINTSAISAAESDGLGDLSPRTFGEASIDLSIIFDPGECTSFGSAYLKSRSSDSFTAALKDFIAPQSIDISNCGRVKFTKEDDNMTALEGAEFTLFVNAPPIAGTEPGIEDDEVFGACTTDAGGMCTINDVLAGEYWAVETVTPSGHETADPQPISVLADELVAVTFVDERIPGKINIHKMDDAGTSLPGAGFTLYNDVNEDDSFTVPPDTSTGETCITDADGDCMISDILPGFYCVVETTVPAGHDPAAPDCFELLLASEVDLVFTNPRQRGAILITKTRKHKAGGGAAQPHPGVTFTVNGVSSVTDANGNVCFGNLLFNDYSVMETVPTGYVADGVNPKIVTVDTKSTCGDDNEATVSFANTPLTDIFVQVDSQVVGGTASKINCTGQGGPWASGDFEENPSLNIDGLKPGTYICTIVIDP